MRDILLVSCLNELTNKIYEMLIHNNKVQLCQADETMLKKTIQISKPELIIVLLNGIDDSADPLFISLSTDYNNIPVLCCGNSNEQRIFRHFFYGKQFHAINTPNSPDEFTEAINMILPESSGASDITAADADVSVTPAVLPVQEHPAQDKKAILLVDDDPLLLRTVRSLLHNKYKILMATSGAEALVVLGRQSPDLIILDYNMPVCDGRQTLKMIRELETAKDIPVIFLTSIGDKPHIEMALKLNPAGYLLKPVKEDMLFEIIEQVI